MPHSVVVYETEGGEQFPTWEEANLQEICDVAHAAIADLLPEAPTSFDIVYLLCQHFTLTPKESPDVETT